MTDPVDGDLVERLLAQATCRTIEIVRRPPGATRIYERRTVRATLVGRRLFIAWPTAGAYEVSLYSGRLKGKRSATAWKLAPMALTLFRELSGWQSFRERMRARDAASNE